MFENFVIFTEVVKLSANTFNNLQNINYHDKLLDLIYERKDIITFERIVNLIQDRYLITKFVGLFEDRSLKDRNRWLENIIPQVDHIDIKAFNEILIITAADCNSFSAVEILVEKGANIHGSKRYRDDLPLECAARNGNLEIIKYFMKRGAKVNSKIVQEAVYKGSLEIVKYLVEEGEYIFHNDNNNNWILGSACCNEDFEVVKYLIERGVVINKGVGVLEAAIRTGDLENLKYVLSKGADINDNIDSAVIAASKCDRLEILKFLKEKGLNLKTQNNIALVNAARKGNLEMVQYLIEEIGANLKVQDDRPLKLAASNGHLETVKYLLEKGADISSQNYAALEYAKIVGQQKVVEYLQMKIKEIEKY